MKIRLILYNEAGIIFYVKMVSISSWIVMEKEIPWAGSLLAKMLRRGRCGKDFTDSLISTISMMFVLNMVRKITARVGKIAAFTT